MVKSWLCAVVCSLALVSPALAASGTMRVPLHGGRLRTSDLSADLLKRLHIPHADEVGFEINLNGLKGTLLIQAWNKALGDGSNIAIDEDELVVYVDTAKLPDDVDSAKLAARVFTEVAAPEATAAQRRSFGILLPRNLDESRALTVLVHGLDCNRFNWAPMADYLERNGHQVAYFTYPSDQPLVDSAALFREQITLLHDAYPNLLINVLTHSMGALVAREYIEGPDYVDGTVQRLVMIAPPNHGSRWASLRLALEFEEHYYLWRDEPEWSPSWMITDGLGEAGRDLKSKSKFIKQLNARERRDGVRYSIIAGNQHPASRIAGDVVSGSARVVPSKVRNVWGFRQTYNGLRHWGTDLRDSNSSSDGPVSVASCKLDGVDDFVLVHADHATIYMPTETQPEPPSWAVVNDRLTK